MIRCSCCGAEAVQAGYCRRCWARQVGHRNRKYVFTAALRDELRAAYTAEQRVLVGRALEAMARRLGWPRWALKHEAQRLGLTRWGGRPWTREEDEYMAERLGSVSVRAIARRLGRSPAAVEARAERLALSRRVREGYSIDDLAQVFGVSRATVQRWMARGLMGKVHQVPGAGRRVAESNVLRFVRRHYHEYDFRRADQLWLKTILFGEVA